MDILTIEHIAVISGFLLILIGIWGMLTQKNINKIIVSFSLFNTGIHIVMVAIAYIRNKTAPIISESVTPENAAESIVDPIPQALVLTAIVIGLGITALMLMYALKMYQQKKSLDITKFKDLKW
jgi:multisubunit Na+/H+ antiporter MnhC subunit